VSAGYGKQPTAALCCALSSLHQIDEQFALITRVLERHRLGHGERAAQQRLRLGSNKSEKAMVEPMRASFRITPEARCAADIARRSLRDQYWTLANAKANCALALLRPTTRGHSMGLFSIEKWLPGERLTAGLVQTSILQEPPDTAEVFAKERRIRQLVHALAGYPQIEFLGGD